MNDFAGTPVILQNPDSTWSAFQRKDDSLKVSPWLIKSSGIYRYLIFKNLINQNYGNIQTLQKNVETPLLKIIELSKTLIVPVPYLGEDQKKEIFTNLTNSLIEENNLSNITIFINLTENETQDPWHPNDFGNKIIAKEISKRIKKFTLP